MGINGNNPTMGELKFMQLYPDAEFIDGWCDFWLYNCYIEVKDCFRGKMGRYYIFLEHHEQLIESVGMYFFVLKKKVQNSTPIIHHVKWMPACAITYDEDHIETRGGRDQFRIPWRKIWPDVMQLDKRRNQYSTPTRRLTREGNSKSR